MIALARACRVLAWIALLVTAYKLATRAPWQSPAIAFTAALVLGATSVWMRRPETPDINQPDANPEADAQ
jgi:hypothetical protein